MPIDLHAHTTASDGSYSPTELVAHARELGLSAVGITDHDTFGGWTEALEAGERLGVEIVPGIELSVSGEAGKFHLLGYYVQSDGPIADALAWVQNEREQRNERIVEKLNTLPEVSAAGGITWEQIGAFADENTQIGRPHFARALMQIGLVDSVQQAFDLYLADGARAHLPKAVLTPEVAVDLIHQAGGIAIWAHPTRPPDKRAAAFDPETAEAQLQKWLEWGLDGLEIYYGAYTPEEAAWAKRMTEKYHLIGSGGSDFHGISKPTVYLGQVNGGTAMPDEVLAHLKEKVGK